jgi:predicted TIM-barrel fold metal-dependent hydrolase
VPGTSNDRMLIVSSDGHAIARMRDFRQYIPTAYHEEFDAFCNEFDRVGYRAADAKSMRARLDRDVADDFLERFVNTDAYEGRVDSSRRIEILGGIGIVAEVIFPDNELPFHMAPPSRVRRGQEAFPAPTPQETAIAYHAYNRWLADYCSVAPERFAPMALVDTTDVDEAVRELHWAKDHGFKGMLLGEFSFEQPVFDPRFDPIWSALEELEMPANSHAGFSTAATTNAYADIPHPSLAIAINNGIGEFFCQELLRLFIWGGIFEKHSNLRLCLTEQGSGWQRGKLQAWDYSWTGSYMRRDVREVVKRLPSEYYEEQCFLGSSIFSREEIEARHRIGVDKMLLGMDYPHHEGTFAAGGTREYLRATLGAACVPVDEARQLVGLNHIERWNLDSQKLHALAAQYGPTPEEILTPPTENLFPRGDVNKPAVVASF